MLDISVVIPAFNEENNILKCLKSIYEQKESNINFEVIVVDDSSTDKTTDKAREFAENNKIKNLKILKNHKNIGRFLTRIEGLKHSKHKLILFIDCKVQLESNAFIAIESIDYEPLIATNLEQALHSSIIDRTYYLIRKKVYKGNYPKMKEGVAYINSENFDTYPKGTTVFLCERKILVESIPKRIDSHSSDDTAWLSNISARKPIMLNNKFEFLYSPRENIWDMLTHLFQRGPKFADYYYQPGKRFFKTINIALLASLIVPLLLILTSTPEILIIIIIGLLITLITASAILSECMTDFIKLLISIPIITTTFGLGVLYGLLLKAYYYKYGTNRS